MKRLETIENEVKKILDKDIRARKDDMYLYYIYCTKYGVLNSKAFVRLFYNKSFRKEYNVPVFESVSRARRKLQQEYEYLRPEKQVQDARINKEADYIRYAINDSDFDKASKVNSNAQLYKQAGNSIVVNVLEAILYNLLVKPSTKNENIIEG